jgi:hypothetical protein
MEGPLTSERKSVKITGVVIPIDWDPQGKILAAAIATSDEDEYRIDEREKGKKLLQLIHENVRVSGEVREEEGKKVIFVKQYSLQKKRKSESM